LVMGAVCASDQSGLKQTRETISRIMALGGAWLDNEPKELGSLPKNFQLYREDC
jgi:predicted small secreted protein